MTVIAQGCLLASYQRSTPGHDLRQIAVSSYIRFYKQDMISTVV